MAESKAHLAICEGDDGIPLWRLHPTCDNIQSNVVVTWLDPYHACVVLIDYQDGTSLVVHDGVVAYAVTSCLFEVC